MKTAKGFGRERIDMNDRVRYADTPAKWWVPIDETPPPISGMYLVASESQGLVGRACYKCLSGEWKFPHAAYAFEPTHWMDIPEPPR